MPCIQKLSKFKISQFTQALDAAAIDPTRTPKERAALVRALRDQQQQSARTAQQFAMIGEKIRIKAIKERNSPVGWARFWCPRARSLQSEEPS